ncbi:MAG: PD-(D/E)XK nuclease family protein [Myxococcales bacterium]|nr:PD-(D/E)XK nuclease family protein [Myxococcales bacterium]
MALNAPNEVSVTEVRNALRCPRIFALGRRRGRPVAFPVGASSLGATFHRIADRAARQVATLPQAVERLAAQASRAAVADALGAWLLAFLVDELEQSPALASMPSEVDDLGEALRELARYLAAEVERSDLRPADALRSLLRHTELEVSAVLGSAQPVRVSGRVDAVHRRSEGALDVVEYKLTDEANQELDQAQVALYRRLLRECLDLEAEPVILRFNPELATTRLAGPAADAWLEERIVPMLDHMVAWATRPEGAPATTRRDLCASCPLRTECLATYRDAFAPRDAPPAGSTHLRPDPEGGLAVTTPAEPRVPAPRDAEGHAEAEKLGKLIVDKLRKLGTVVEVAQRTVGPTLLGIEVVATRARVAQLDRLAGDVEHQLADRHVHFEKNEGRRAFWATRKRPRRVELAELLGREAEFLRQRPGRFVVGEGVDGSVVKGDLSDGSTSHLLVGGQTGSGKSVLLRAIVSSLCHYHPPSAIRFTLVDPKRVTFGAFAAAIAPHLEGPLFFDSEAFLPELESLVAEMEARYERFEQARVQDIHDYNETAPEPLARRVVVVDEFQDFLTDKATREAFLASVQRLGAKARAAGIHLICATQRPDRTTVPGGLKANLGGKIALRVQSAVNSRIILDEVGAERLLGHGDLLANLGHGTVRAQGPLV